MNSSEQSKFSRLALAIGTNSLTLLKEYKVGLIGLSVTGTEIVKNLILSGVLEIHIHDNDFVRKQDIGNNFYLREIDNGKPLLPSLIPRLQILNPSSRLIEEKTLDFNGWLSKMDIIIVSKILKFNDILSISQFARDHKIGFIFAGSAGLASGFFSDFGPNFSIENSNGLKPTRLLVRNISNSSDSLINVFDNSEREGFGVGSQGHFEGFEGIQGLNGKTCTIKKFLNHNPCYIKTDFDGSTIPNFNQNCKTYGYFVQDKIPIVYNHIPFSESLSSDPEIKKKVHRDEIVDFLISLSQFYQNHDRLPQLFSFEDASTFPEELKDYVLFSASEFSPSSIVLGAFVAQEAIKYCTHVFELSKTQWFTFDVKYIIGKNYSRETLNPTTRIGKFANTRYETLSSIISAETLEKIQNSTSLFVGAGAVGSEDLRCASLFGIKDIIIMDDDKIEPSNLTRQFMFHNEDIGKYKAEVAASAIMDYNPDIKAIAHHIKFSQEIEKELPSTIKLVFSGVDSFIGRAMLFGFAQALNVPLINGGLLRTTCDFSIFIPFRSNILYIPNSSIESTATCTIRQIPTTPTHIITEAHNQFIKWFFKIPTNYNNMLNSQEGDQKGLSDNDLVQIVHFAKTFPQNWTDCVRWACKKIEKVVYKRPYKLLKTASAEIFKDFCNRPEPFHIDPNNADIFSFVLAASKLKARLYGISFTPDDISTEKILNIISEERGLCNDNVDMELKSSQSNNELMKQFNEFKKGEIFPFDFDKDDPDMVSALTSYSRARAELYKITKPEYLDVMRIAGKIMPTMVTTTSCSGAGSFMMLPTIYFEDNFKSTGYITLSNCYIDISSVKSKEVIWGKSNQKHNIWEMIELSGDITVEQAFNQISEMLNVDIDMMSFGSNSWIMKYDDKVQNSCLRDVLSKNHDFRNCIIQIYSEEEEAGSSIYLPSVVYRK